MLELSVKETMERIDRTTGEILNIPRGGLYTPLPVPAYKVLVAAKKHIAKDVLICIVSHLDRGGTKAFPSYTTIARESGHSKGSIKKALDVLYELEFLKVHQQPIGIRKRNFYFVQEACYDTKKMSKKALQYLPILKVCFYCGKGMRQGEFQVTVDLDAHWGCSALPRKRKLTIQMTTNTKDV